MGWSQSLEDSMRKSVGLGIGLASVAVLAAAGIASANAIAGSGATPDRPTNMTSTLISQGDAERIAEAAVPDSSVTESRLDTDHGRTVWNVHLSTPTGEVEAKVDAQSGAVRIDDDQAEADADTLSDDNDGDDDGTNHDANDDHGNDAAGHATNDDRGHDGSGHDGPGHN
jgi:hypothetical protein